LPTTQTRPRPRPWSIGKVHPDSRTNTPTPRQELIASYAERKAARKVIARKEAYLKRSKKAAAKAERKAAKKEFAQSKVKAKQERRAAKLPEVVDPHKGTKVLNRLLTRAAKLEMRGQRMLKEAQNLREKHAAQLKQDEVCSDHTHELPQCRKVLTLLL
jgi:hypothetical protein